MELIIIILLSAIVIVAIRNEKVYKFRNIVNDKCYEYNIRRVNEGNYKESAYVFCYDTLPSYDKMVLSLKPLKMETYFSDEMIKKLNS